ncbi:MAG: hypothetical protein ACJAVJ_002466 [Planctomycetota bacterium]|jgi:hypothetical protein
MNPSHTAHLLAAFLLAASTLFSCAISEEATEASKARDQGATVATAVWNGDPGKQLTAYEQLKIDADIAFKIAAEVAKVEAARRKVEVARLSVEHKLAAEQDAMFERDILDAMETLVGNANQVAEQEDGKIYLGTQSLDRVVYVVPGDSLGETYPSEDWYALSKEPILRDVPGAEHAGFWRPGLDEQAVVTQWTDTFLVAVEQLYRYQAPRVVSIEQRPTEPYLVGRVAISLSWSSRSAVSGIPGELPLEPEGYRYWHPSGFAGGRFGGRMGGRKNLRAAYDANQPDVDFQLEQVASPNGVLVTLDQSHDQLALGALEALSSVPMKEETKELTLDLMYSFKLNRWILRYPNTPPTLPSQALPWLHGIESYGGIYIGRPAQLEQK